MTNQEILTKMAEQFMVPVITGHIKWMQLDTPNDGIVSCPANDLTTEQFAASYDMDATEVEFVSGHGARLSAPGYMEAEQYLVDTYGDDIEEDEDNG